MPDTALPDTTVITESFWTPNVRQQVISTCTSATRPTGVEGRTIYETDTDLLLTYSGSAWAAFAGPISGGTSHTPTLTQGASVNIAKTVNSSRWRYVGFKTIHWAFSLSATASGTAGSNATLTLPVAAASTSVVSGHGSVYDASTTTLYNATVAAVSTSVVFFQVDGATSGSGWGTSPNLALASGDSMSGSITYEIA